MGRIEKSIEIKVPREKVWEMLALDRWPEWMDEWKNAEYTSEVRKPKDKYRVGASAHPSSVCRLSMLFSAPACLCGGSPLGFSEMICQRTC